MSLNDPGAGTEKILAADLPDGKRVRTYFLCTKKETPTTQKGSTYLRVSLRDASGDLTGINWEPDTLLLGAFDEGDVVEIEGKYKLHEKYGPQLYVDSARRLDEGAYDAGSLVAVSPVATGDLDTRLKTLLAAVGDGGLRAVLERALDPAREPGATFAVVPAAIRNHHAYRHGLLEHSVIVAETASRVAGAFDSVDTDLVIAGGLLHDIGKTRAYSADPLATGLTDEGYLLGEIVAGLEIVTALISETPGLAPDQARLLQHVIAAHHGEREKGSPVVPQTREAVIVHYCDDMTARVAAIDEAASKLPDDSTWTPQRVGMLGVSAYLGGGEFTPLPTAASAPASDAAVTDAPPVTAAGASGDAAGDDATTEADEDFGFYAGPEPAVDDVPTVDEGADASGDDEAAGASGDDAVATPADDSDDSPGSRLFD